jgi:hypothetical protein
LFQDIFVLKFLSIICPFLFSFYFECCHQKVFFVSNFVNPPFLYMNHHKPLSFSFFFEWPSQVPTKPTTYAYLPHLQFLGGRL